jgi:2-C-methyl-D-erythritol 4-phosphate cytidylyltransferase
VAQLKGSAVPVIDSVESIRKVEGNKSCAVNRNHYKLVQTPQVFHSSNLIAAYNVAYDPHFTDDASVFENNGETIHLVEGNRENIKITTPIDMELAEFFLSKHQV